jgi:TPR repeat protein
MKPPFRCSLQKILMAGIFASLVLAQPAEAEKTGSSDTAAPSALTMRFNAGETKALLNLGDQYRDGSGVAQDIQAALGYYRQAAALGDAKAMLRLGEILALGKGVDASPAEGLALTRKSADLGDIGAMILLGDLLALGFDGADKRKLAIAEYERAAAKGRTLALVKLAVAYQDGQIVSADAEKAISYYREAIAAGRSDAMLGLGKAFVERRFAGQGSLAEGVALLKEALVRGAPEAAVVLSDCYINGLGVPKNADKAIALLKDEWAKGNVRAGLRLISLYRDGRKKAIEPDRFLAEYYLRSVSHKLDATAAQIEKLLMKAAVEKAGLEFASFREELQQIPMPSRTFVVRKLRAINPNAYVYLVQVQLGELNIFQGKPNGTLSRATVRAMFQYCVKHRPAEVCRLGPMTPGVADAIVTAF